MATIQDEEAAIRARMDSFVSAFATGDIDTIMKNYVQDKSFILFDVVPREDFRGADLYRAAWKEMFTHFEGRPTITIADLGILVDGQVAFSYCFMHLAGTDKQGKPVDRWVRVTDGFRKIGGEWLIAHEHISVPVDFRTGKLVPVSRP